MGDIIAGLGAVKELCEKENAKAKIILDTTGGLTCNDDETNSFIYISSRKKPIKFNDSNYNFLKPLIEIQPYVESVEKYIDQTNIDYNLNKFRYEFITCQNLLYAHQKILNLTPGYKGQWLFYNKPFVEEKLDIIITRSARYQSSHIFYAACEEELLNRGKFIGTDFEYELFKESFRFTPQRYEVRNALDCLKAVSNSNVVITNATLMFWIALGFNHPKILHEQTIAVNSTTFTENETNIEYFIGFDIKKPESFK